MCCIVYTYLCEGMLPTYVSETYTSYGIGVIGLSNTNKYVSSNASHIRRVSYSDILLIKGLNKIVRYVGLYFYLPIWYVVCVTCTPFYNFNMQNGIWFFFLLFYEIQNIDRLSIPTKKRAVKYIWCGELTYQRCSHKPKCKRCIECFY